MIVMLMHALRSKVNLIHHSEEDKKGLTIA